MHGILLDLAGHFEVRVRPHKRSIFRFAIRVVRPRALVLDVRHGAVDDHLGRTAWGVRERNSILDLVLIPVNAGEDKDPNKVGITLGNPIATVLKVQPGLEGRLFKQNMYKLGRRPGITAKRLTDAIWIPVLLFFQLAMPSST